MAIYIFRWLRGFAAGLLGYSPCFFKGGLVLLI